MNLVSLLILPGVISMQDNNARYAIAGVSLLILLGAIAFSKRGTTSMDADPNITAAATVAAAD